MNSITRKSLYKAPVMPAEASCTDLSLPDFIVVSGGMGVGKGTVIEASLPILNEHAYTPNGRELHLSRSWTTRKRRENEPVDAYTFVSEEEFAAEIAAGGFYEWTYFLGTYYGTPKPRIGGPALLAEIEVDGARNVRKTTGQSAPLFFIGPKNAETQLARLISRPDGTPIEKKLQRFERFIQEELTAVDDLPYHIIVNDQLSLAVSALVLGVRGIHVGCMHGNEKRRYLEKLHQQGERILTSFSPRVDV